MLDPKAQAACEQFISTAAETYIPMFGSFFSKALNLEILGADGNFIKLTREEAMLVSLDLAKAAIANVMNMPPKKEDEE